MKKENNIFGGLNLDPKVKEKNKQYFQIGAGIIFLIVILNSLIGSWFIVLLGLIILGCGFFLWKKPNSNTNNDFNRYECAKTYKLSKDDIESTFGFSKDNILNIRVDKTTKDILVEVKK